MEERICQLCQQGVEMEEHNVAIMVFSINKELPSVLKQAFGPLRKLIKYKYKQCLGLFILELERHNSEM
jgi:hypothetical protein